MAFKKLGLSEELVNVLKMKGFESPSEIQTKTIPLALAGKDIIGGSATGSGKTLAFASSIIDNLVPNKNVQALILTPTRELAEQVSDSIKEFSKNIKLSVLPVYGGVNIEAQIRNLRKTDVVVGTPGRILDHMQRDTLCLRDVKFLVLDEVDRMLDMGFHVDVDKIISQCPKERQTMLFSATISSDLDHLAKKYTRNAEEVSVKSYLDASKLKQVYYDVDNRMKFSLLVHFLKKDKKGLAMVFCSTRSNVDFVTGNLMSQGIRSRAIHGGMDQKKRIRVLKEFHDKQVEVLVCTDVAARGLDIKDVGHVYNYDLPKTADDYIHRVGRTARAGENGMAINLLSNRDYENFSTITNNKNLNIEKEELPFFNKVWVDLDAGRKSNSSGGRGFGGRDRGRSGGRDSGRSSGGRDSGRGPSRGPSRFGSRDSGSRGPSRFGGRDSGSRGPSQGGRDSGSRGPRQSGGRDNFSRGPSRGPPSRGGSSNRFGGRDSGSPSRGGRTDQGRRGSRDSGSRGPSRFGNRDSGRPPSRGGRTDSRSDSNRSGERGPRQSGGRDSGSRGRDSGSRGRSSGPSRGGRPSAGRVTRKPIRR
jgi:ATP-dependent RNA helicase DeaD